VNSTIDSLPLGWKLYALGLLFLGIVFVLLFLGRYTRKLPWASTEEGKHLVAMSAVIGGFLILYLALAAWPDMPYRHAVRLVLFTALVAVLGHRWWLLEAHLRERRRRGTPDV
jgi:hypothetical protein